ncbi:MAG: small nuclear ribonucleo E [Lasallia pustulata]|uniref:Small nuclear ribonucleoprotein E n=1 Tax=Lasallia pustulata TaxID=136370 RepID=A0A5M8Q1M3_9LECA|nr:MAG: small nuclear ribonucleo E [Lasallia pustulata]
MTGRGGGRGKVLLPPINFIFKLLQQHSTVSIWLYEQLAIRIEGKIRVGKPRLTGLPGFDEFMNLVIDDAVEVKQATKTDPEEKRRALGREIRHIAALLGERADICEGQILLKGDNVSLIQALQ